MDITCQRLNEIYDAFAAEQMTLTAVMRNRSDEEGKEKEKSVTKQLSLINTIMISLLRLRNVRKDLAYKLSM